MSGSPADPPFLIHRVIARLNVGGPAMHVVNLAGALNDGPWRTRLVAGRVPEGEGDMAYYADERAIPVTHLSELSREISVLHDVRTLWALFRLFRRERPAVVHTHTAKAGALGRVAARIAGVPVRIHTYHGHVLGGGYFRGWKTRLFLAIERWLARSTDRLIVLTRRQALEMAEELRVAPLDRFSVVPLGLELGPFATVDRVTARRSARAVLGLDASTPVIGIVGRLVAIKNHELFLEALSEARKHRSGPMAALVVGSGDLEPKLRSMAIQLGLDDVVHWLGWRRDLPELYSAMDALALTSHDEGTPVAVLEALASGTPVVARDVGGVSEILAETGGGTVLSREAGAEPWAEALEEATRRDGLPPEARSAVGERFSVQRLARNMAALYEAELRP